MDGPRKPIKRRWLTPSLIILFFLISTIFVPNFSGQFDSHNKSFEDTLNQQYNNSITNKDKNTSIPIQKNSNLKKITLQVWNDDSKGFPSNPKLNLGEDSTIWKYPKEYGALNQLNTFSNGKKEVTLSLSSNGNENKSILIPESEMKASNLKVFRSDIESKYNIKGHVDDNLIWDKQSGDRLFNQPKNLITNGNYPTDYMWTSDYINQNSTKYISLGPNDGSVRLYSLNEKPDQMASFDPQKGRTNKVKLVQGNSSIVRGVGLFYEGDYYSFQYDIEKKELENTHLNSTDRNNKNLITVDLNNDSIEDVVSSRNEHVIVSFSNNTKINPFNYSYKIDNHITDLYPIKDENEFVVSTSSNISRFGYEDGSLRKIEEFNPANLSNIEKIAGFNYDNNEFLDYCAVDGSKSIHIIKQNESNFTLAKSFETDYHIKDIATTDFDKNGFGDIGFSAFYEEKLIVKLNNNTSFNKEKEISVSNKPLELNLIDHSNDGDQDVFITTKKTSTLLINDLNWISEKISDFSPTINSYLDSTTPEYDRWNNPMVEVPLNFTSEYPANLTLSDLNIEYNYTPTINITEAVKDYVSTHPANETGWVNVPLNFTADNDEGEINVDVDIDYGGRAPVLEKPIPDTYEVVTGEFAEGVIDLSSYYQDPNDLDVDYLVSYMENESRLGAFIDENKVTFTSKGYTGKYDFRVKAVNSEGYVQESNTFTVKVIPPPPELDLPDEYKVRASQRTWFNISEYASSYENKGEVGLSTDSDSVTAHPDNMTLEMYYTEENITEEVEISLTVDNSTASDTINVTTTPYDVPLFEPLPNIFLERDENLTEEHSFNLHEYTTHPEESIEDLNYSLFWEDDRYINLGIENGWVLGWIDETYTGTSNVEVEVTDSEGNTDSTTFDLTVNDTKYPPTYTGGLKDVTVEQGDRWTIDLTEYFEHEREEELLYQCNQEEIMIVNHSWAVWEPDKDSSDLTEVIFTARLSSYPELKASSDPINLYFEEKPPMPRYLGGLYSRVVQPGEGWRANLTDHFSYELGEERLHFSTNTEEIKIDQDNGTVSWSPDPEAISLRNVTFTAYDIQNSSRSVRSNTIDLVIPSEGTPEAEIISITPTRALKTETIKFVGNASGSLGNTSYRWTSSIDGRLSDKKEFTSKLSPGEHVIELQVKDLRGNWSGEDSMIIEVKEKQSKQREFSSFLNSTDFQIVLAIIITGLALNFLGNHVLPNKDILSSNRSVEESKDNSKEGDSDQI